MRFFSDWVVCEGWSSSGATAEIGCLLSLLLGSYSPDEEGIWPRGPRRRRIEVQSAEVCYKCQATFSCLCRFITLKSTSAFPNIMRVLGIVVFCFQRAADAE